MAEQETHIQAGEEIGFDTFGTLAELDVANEGLVEWVTAWTRRPHAGDPNRVDWIRLGHSIQTQSPGFSELIIYEGASAGSQVWRNLVDEPQLDEIMAGLDTEDLRLGVARD